MSREVTPTTGVTRLPAVLVSGGTQTSAPPSQTPHTMVWSVARTVLREERNISGAGGMMEAGATVLPPPSTGRESVRRGTTTTNCGPSWVIVRGNQPSLLSLLSVSGLTPWC